MTHTDKLRLDYFRNTGRVLRSNQNSQPLEFADVTIDENTLLDAFDMPPEKAVEFLKKKGYQVTWSWIEMQREAHDKAFTVAKATSADVLQTIREAVDSALNEGTTLRDFKKNLTPKLESLGWVGKKDVVNPATGKVESVELATPRRLKLIYEMNLQSAYMNSRWQQIAESGTPYVRYFNPQPETEICLGLNGKVFRADDSAIRLPPLHWGCKTNLGPISERKFIRDGMELSDVSLIKSKVDDAFDSPPGTQWKPDLNRYDSDIAKKLKQELSRG